MKKLKKLVYYILLTFSFIILPVSIRNIYYSILIKSNILEILINILASTFIFGYPFSLALVIRYNLKYNKWPFKFLYEEE